MRLIPIACGFAATLVACGSRQDVAPHAAAPSDTAVTAATRHAFPSVGVAVEDTAGKWCAEFSADSSAPPVHAGDRVTLVFLDPSANTSLTARIVQLRAAQCHSEFAQPRWISYAPYDLELTGSPSGSGRVPTVALVVASDATWTHDSTSTDWLARADLDGDGVPEEARRCLADEGEHFTIWSRTPQNARVLRWHEYYDWGAFTDANCGPGEKGERGG